MSVLPNIRVQSVLYRNNDEELQRAISAATNALGYAKQRGMIGGWSLAFGDSSPEPVLDSGSVAQLTESIVGLGGAFEYDFFDVNLGHGGGHNRLHEHAQTEDLLLILNPDGILAPDAISELIGAFLPGVGIVDARQLPLEHPKWYDPTTFVTSWSSLACGLTSSAIFREVGGIDHETFYMYCDDVDLSWRIRLAGYEARYCPQARMFHDKRIDKLGRFVAGEVEKYSSAEAALLLAYKYSRDDIVENLEAAMSAGDDEYQYRAVTEFAARREMGNLPERLDPNNLVAEFVKGTYGAHRF